MLATSPELGVRTTTWRSARSSMSVQRRRCPNQRRCSSSAAAHSRGERADERRARRSQRTINRPRHLPETHAALRPDAKDEETAENKSAPGRLRSFHLRGPTSWHVIDDLSIRN
jgi:hypothetical protein